jgi:anti-sigma factor RsiW
MANLPPLSDEERAELVAYLDGELPKPAVRALEAKLTTNPHLRTEAETLRKTWELLDHLPKPEPSPDFASRTLDRVSTIRATPIRIRAGSVSDRRKLWGVGWAAAVILALAIGYEGGHFLSSRTVPGDQGRSKDVQPQLVEDFRVIENQRLYAHVDDLDFLRALQDSELFGEDN